MAKFELDEFHRNVSDSDLLEDLRRVASRVVEASVSRTAYELNRGAYHSNTLERRFGSWNKALTLAGLGLNNRKDISEDELLEDLRRIAAKLGSSSITGEAYESNGAAYARTTLIKRFKSWNKALELAGLQVSHRINISNEDLMSNIESVWRHLARQPTLADMRAPQSKFGGKTYVHRFGTWRKALEAFIAFINAGEKDGGVIQDESPIEPQSASPGPDFSRASARGNRHINWRMRFLVMRRDDFKCRYCGRSPANNPGLELHIDHVQAYSKDGPTTMENLRTACNVCNIGKSNLDAEEVT